MEEIVAIHDRVIEETGGAKGIRDVGLLFSLAEKPKTVIARVEVYGNIFIKAAVLLEAIVNYHVFVDGNKRTAFLACLVFLSMNNVSLNINQVATYKFIISVAEKKKTIKSITQWLKKYSK